MTSLPSKKHTAVAWLLFAVIFAALLITATFTDLQVSRILTKGTLPEGEFYATGVFGVVCECIGCATPYFIGSLAFSVLALYCLRFMENKYIKCGGFTLLTALSGVMHYIALDDTFKYNIRHLHLEGKPAFVTGEFIVLAAILTFAFTLAINNYSDDSIKALAKAAFAYALAIAIGGTLVEVLKGPFGRTRFRAMNYAGDFSYYTRWYVLNGQPDKQWMIDTFSSTDACKSFPSGHTQSASMMFTLVMLKDALNIKSKKKIALLWTAGIVWTGIIAVSRIMVGAHFFSDVLMGGTIGFLSVMLGREVFLCKFSHFKALFGKSDK